jgi:hypothetical protein
MYPPVSAISQVVVDPASQGSAAFLQSSEVSGFSSFKAADLHTAQVCATILNSVFLHFDHIAERWQFALKPKALSN